MRDPARFFDFSLYIGIPVARKSDVAIGSVDECVGIAICGEAVPITVLRSFVLRRLGSRGGGGVQRIGPGICPLYATVLTVTPGAISGVHGSIRSCRSARPCAAVAIARGPRSNAAHPAIAPPKQTSAAKPQDSSSVRHQ
jgi:hypothetical protein